MYTTVRLVTITPPKENPGQNFSFEMRNIRTPRVTLPAAGAKIFEVLGAFMWILKGETRRRRRKFWGSLAPRSQDLGSKIWKY